MGKETKEKKALNENSIDTTVNLHKLTHSIQFKKKAPRALSEIRKLVHKLMRTPDVRIDARLNEFIWSNGIRNLPKKVRVRVTRKRNDEDAEKKSEWFSVVQYLDVDEFSGRLTEKSKSAWSIFKYSLKWLSILQYPLLLSVPNQFWLKYDRRWIWAEK